jgi:hypothetical protein
MAMADSAKSLVSPLSSTFALVTKLTVIGEYFEILGQHPKFVSEWFRNRRPQKSYCLIRVSPTALYA